MKNDKSDICMKCGYCCDGTMFSEVKVSNDVENGLDKIGDSVYDRGIDDMIFTSYDKKLKESCLVFKQPCPKLKDKKCTIYEERPYTCKQFKCKLLKNYNAGDKTYDEAIDIIEKKTAREFLYLEDYIRYVKQGRFYFSKKNKK